MDNIVTNVGRNQDFAEKLSIAAGVCILGNVVYIINTGGNFSTLSEVYFISTVVSVSFACLSEQSQQPSRNRAVRIGKNIAAGFCCTVVFIAMVQVFSGVN